MCLFVKGNGILEFFFSDFFFNRMVCFVEQQVFVPLQMVLHVAE
jgi:hypothetical protein